MRYRGDNIWLDERTKKLNLHLRPCPDIIGDEVLGGDLVPPEWQIKDG